EKQLKDAGLPTDGPGLLDFFRKRTLSNADQEKLQTLVRQLGDDTFRAREQATRELVKIGRAALPFLRPALTDPDAEVARRARHCVKAIEDPANAILTAAAVRVLAARRPAGTVEVLLAFAPFDDEETTVEEVRVALAALGLREGKAVPALLTALTDRE